MMDLPAAVGASRVGSWDRRRHQYTSAAHALPAAAAAATTATTAAATQNSRAHAFSTLVLCEWPTRSVVVHGSRMSSE